MKQTSLVEQPVNFAEAGEQISHELAAKMVKNHHDKHGYENSFSYATGKQLLIELLSQPGCVGMRLIDAIDENGNQTLVYVGIDSKGNNMTEVTAVNEMGKLAVTEGMVLDRTIIKNGWTID